MSKRPDEQLKLRIVQHCLSQNITSSQAASQYELDESSIRAWINRYLQHGVEGLRKKHTHHSAAFKQMVLEHMWREGLSKRQTEYFFDIRERGAVGKWERQYHSGGLAALEPKPKGRKPMPTKPSVSKTSTSLPRPDEELSRDELLEELTYLRAENDYLKKLDALIRERRATAQGKKPKSSKN